MRDIKFRAWHLEFKKMYFYDLWIPWQDEDEEKAIEFYTKRMEFMQYTGLIHKGREVFEGDIYYIAGTGNCYVKLCPLYGVVFRSPDGEESAYVDDLMENDIEDYLGNIYENPELLKS